MQNGLEKREMRRLIDVAAAMTILGVILLIASGFMARSPALEAIALWLAVIGACLFIAIAGGRVLVRQLKQRR